jgi:hypothetical protein
VVEYSAKSSNIQQSELRASQCKQMRAVANNKGLRVGEPKLLSNGSTGALKIDPDMYYNQFYRNLIGDLSVALFA